MPLCSDRPFMWLLPLQTLSPRGTPPTPNPARPVIAGAAWSLARSRPTDPVRRRGDRAIAHSELTRGRRRTFPLEAGPPTRSSHAGSGWRRRRLERDAGGCTWPRSVLFRDRCGGCGTRKTQTCGAWPSAPFPVWVYSWFRRLARWQLRSRLEMVSPVCARGPTGGGRGAPPCASGD